MLKKIEEILKMDWSNEFVVDDKFQEIPIDYIVSKKSICVTWKCRHESARTIMIDLDNSVEMDGLLKSLTEVKYLRTK